MGINFLLEYIHWRMIKPTDYIKNLFFFHKHICITFKLYHLKKINSIENYKNIYNLWNHK